MPFRRDTLRAFTTTDGFRTIHGHLGSGKFATLIGGLDLDLTAFITQAGDLGRASPTGVGEAFWCQSGSRGRQESGCGFLSPGASSGAAAEAGIRAPTTIEVPRDQGESGHP